MPYQNAHIIDLLVLWISSSMDINLKLFRNFYGIIKLFQCFNSIGCFILFAAPSSFTLGCSFSRLKRYLAVLYTVLYTVCHFYSLISSQFISFYVISCSILVHPHTHAHTKEWRWENEKKKYLRVVRSERKNQIGIETEIEVE